MLTLVVGQPAVVQAAEEFEIVLILGTWIVAISQFTQPLGGTAPQNWWLGHPSAHSSRARWRRRSPDLAIGSTVNLKETYVKGASWLRLSFPRSPNP